MLFLLADGQRGERRGDSKQMPSRNRDSRPHNGVIEELHWIVILCPIYMQRSWASESWRHARGDQGSEEPLSWAQVSMCIPTWPQGALKDSHVWLEAPGLPSVRCLPQQRTALSQHSRSPAVGGQTGTRLQPLSLAPLPPPPSQV